MSNYRELKVWNKAHSNTLEIYRLTSSFPKEEAFGITSQIRRAVLSVELNIVEGQSRSTNKDFVKFLYIARASNQEVNCLLLVAFDLGMINQSNYDKLLLSNNEVGRMLNGLIKSLH